MIKADDKVTYENGSLENFTNFEFLKTQVEVLQDTVNKLVSILKENNIKQTKEIEAEYFDYEEVFKRLENEN